MTRRWILGFIAGTVLALTALTAVFAQDSTTTLDGTLSRDGEAYFVGDVEVDFGPTWYTSSTNATSDFDGNGSVGTLEVELDGLLGSEVIISGDNGRFDDVDVITLNETTYRRMPLEPAPWAGGPGRNSSVPSEDSATDGPPSHVRGAATTEVSAGPPSFAGEGERDGLAEDQDGPPPWVDGDRD